MEIKELYELYKQHPVVTTDSRDCPAGSIFIALKGASFDGNKFAASALEKGCAYAIVDEAEYVQQGDPRFILVPDALTTYKELAREHRRLFQFPVIGITGTNGKTTTKELLSAVLSERFNVLYTEGNFNNDVGVPRTLLRLRPEHDIAVIEMGASHPGDIKQLVDYVEPTCGLITNVGLAHLQGFGSFEGVKATKGELYDFLKAHGALTILNLSNEHLVQMAADRHISNVQTYGTDTEHDTDVRGKVIDCAPFLRFSWQAKDGAEHVVSTHLIGAYNIDNMLAAITVGLHYGITAEQICHALESYMPHNNRSQLTVTAKNSLVVDAYNANPTSMHAALENFEYMQVSPKMAILGDMRELGDTSKEQHQEIANYLQTLHINKVWLVGDEFYATDSPFRKFKNVEEVKQALATEQPEGYYILVKGSNGIKLYQLPDIL